MQLAYSLKFGEIVAAGNADYGDCAKHQLTCPSCREAVFKGLRNRPREIHYFSHYRASDDNEQCELRVAHMAHAAGAVDGFIGHGQTLDRFMNSFRESILTSYRRFTGRDIRQATLDVYSKPYFLDYEGVIDLILSKTETHANPRDILASAILTAPAFRNRSPFWSRRCAAYVLDTMRHLKVRQARDNKRFLLAAAFAAWTHQATEPGQKPTEVQIENLVRCISRGGSAKAVRQLQKAYDVWFITRRFNSDPILKLAPTMEEARSEILRKAADVPEELKTKFYAEQVLWAAEKQKKYRSRLTEITGNLEELSLEYLVDGMATEVYGPIIGLLAAGLDTGDAPISTLRAPVSARLAG